MSCLFRLTLTDMYVTVAAQKVERPFFHSTVGGFSILQRPYAGRADPSYALVSESVNVSEWEMRIIIRGAT